MGKKSKANRKKAPVPTAAVTATAAVAVVAAATETRRGEFPESTFLVKGESLLKKGNHAKAQKIYLQGIEHGCVRCLMHYTMPILYNGATRENRMTSQLFEDNKYLHLVLPLLLEGAIRGNHDAVLTITGVYSEVVHKTEDFHRYGHIQPATPLLMYWSKHAPKNQINQNKQYNKEMKEFHGIDTSCSVCGNEDSKTVTLMKCDGCKFYYYCSKECQKIMWQEGQHAGVCRQLGLLKKYHKPFAKKIWKDIAVHGIPPQDIPELQELRQQLGLSRPQDDYQDLLEAVQAGRLDVTQLILPRKDGTVQIGSFPRPM